MTDKFKRRVREHAEKHGMSYQAALQQLTAEGKKTVSVGGDSEGFAEAARNLGICAVFKPGRAVCKLDHGHGGAHDYGKTGLVHRDMFDQMEAERDEARRMARALRSEAGWEETWPLPWESDGDVKKIIVNGLPVTVTDDVLSYEQVLSLAYPGIDPARILTVVVKHRDGRGSSLEPGKSVRVESEMVFSAMDTSNA